MMLVWHNQLSSIIGSINNIIGSVIGCQVLGIYIYYYKQKQKSIITLIESEKSSQCRRPAKTRFAT